MSRYLFLGLSLALLAACATTTVGPGWRDVPATVWVAKNADYSVELPNGWLVQSLKGSEGSDMMAATLEGPLLQRIVVIRRDNEHAFEGIEKGAMTDMLPQDLAERYIAETKSQFELDVVDVIGNAPASIDGVDGFRLHLGAMVGELRYQMIAYGVSTPDGFYEISYVTPTLHYFERDREQFEASAASFRFKPMGE